MMLCMMLRQTQQEIHEWSERNFGPVPNSQLPLRVSSFLGMVEEMGELAHAVLKWAQGIRGTPAEHQAEIEDAIADLLVYTLDFCARNDMDAQALLSNTWEKVKQRDWEKYPHTGTAEVAQ